jgi:hypothetical protein
MQPEDELELQWAADMAVRLLRDQAACAGVGDSGTQWCTWLRSLPEHVSTPLEFGEQELALLADEGVAAEVQGMQAYMRSAYEVRYGMMVTCRRGWVDAADVASLHPTPGTLCSVKPCALCITRRR